MLSDLSIVEEPPTAAAYAGYARISIAFRVTSRVRPGPDGQLVEDLLGHEYIKDYEGPDDWAKRWDISRWCIVTAYGGSRRIGGAVVVWRTSGVDMLEGRDDLAVLWDLRIDPEFRRRGIGSKLFAAAAMWARERPCRELKIETQDVNVAACRLYASMGAELRTMHSGIYWDAPEEMQMLWYMTL